MRFAYSADQQHFRATVRAYFEGLMTPELAAGLNPEGGPRYGELVRRLGQDGWLGLGFSSAYGGGDRSLTDQLIFYEEAERLAVPLPHLTISTVGPMIQRFGSDEQKARLLPGVVEGKTLFCIGYTEPGSGTDLGSLRTRAVRDGDTYVINGAKIFTSQVQEADYVWLAVRTDPSTADHSGLSVLLVPTGAPGFSWTPIEVMGEVQASATYYDNVRVPTQNLVGDEGDGWSLITSQLNNERVMLFTVAGLSACLDLCVEWTASAPSADGRTVLDLPWVRRNLAEVRARVEASRLKTWELAPDLESGKVAADQSAVYKVMTTETLLRGYRLLMEVLGEAATLDKRSPGAVLSGRVDQFFRHSLVHLFGGGANDVLRAFISEGLGMPRNIR